VNDHELDSLLKQIPDIQLPSDLRRRTLREFDTRRPRKRIPVLSWKWALAIAGLCAVASVGAVEVMGSRQPTSAAYKLPDGNVLLVSDIFTPTSLRSWVWWGLWHKRSEMHDGELHEIWTIWARELPRIAYTVTPRSVVNGQYDLVFTSSDTRSVENHAFEVPSGTPGGWMPLPVHELVTLDRPFELRIPAPALYIVRLTISRPTK
jgi:hypothetical protein